MHARAFSEEYFSGTIELLITKPISVLNIVLAKYLSVMSIVFISILTTLIYTISINYLTESQVNIDFRLYCWLIYWFVMPK